MNECVSEVMVVVVNLQPQQKQLTIFIKNQP